VFWKSERKVESLILSHLELVDKTLRSFQQALVGYLQGSDQMKQMAAQVHDWESKADDVRREVTTQLLKGSLLGSFKGDMLRLVEDLDKLANIADALIVDLTLQHINIPSELYENIESIGAKSINILEELNPAVKLLFSDMGKVRDHTRRIEKLEGEIDTLEHAIIRDLFQMDLSLAEKLWVRDFITHLAQLSDRAEDLSDLIEIIVAKRKV
jgi:predicted phosphate transport protein (TIGR00153 family)